MVALTGDYTEVLLDRRDWEKDGKCDTAPHFLALVEMLFHIMDDKKHGVVVMRWQTKERENESES